MSGPRNQNTKAPPYPRIKYNDDRFRDIIPTLPLDECLKIEYRAKGVWFKMISKRNNSHNCECCGITNVGITPIVDHIRGKKHRIALQAADKLYHPQYTAPKPPSKSPARTPLLDAYLRREGFANELAKKQGGSAPAQKPGGTDSAQKPDNASTQKPESASAQKPESASAQKPGPASAQKPGPASAQKPGPASAQKPGPASAQKPGPASAQKPGPASAQKPGPASQKPGPASAQKPGPASAQKPGPASAQKPGPASAQKPGPASAQKPGPASAQKSNQSNATQRPGPASSKKPAPADKSDPKSNASPAVSASNASESKDTSDKKKDNDNNKTNQSQKANRDPSPEIVVLDDDDDDDIPPQKAQPSASSNNSNTQNNSQKDNIVGQAIPVAGTAVPKDQRPNRRIVNPHAIMQQNKSMELEARKAQNPIPAGNRVINPAAVLAQSAEKNDDENTPRYQQNRVVIPSNNRKRGQQTGEQQQQQQNFTTKTFSAKTPADDHEGIIGVEYVVKILKVYNDPEPFYECCLCEVVMDGIGMQGHLLGYNHRYKYIEKHFPTCFNQFKEHIGNIQLMGLILDRLAKAIEAHHGRELPYECLSGEFRSNRHGVMTTVYSFRHASEYSGPSFTNIMDAKEVAELCKNKVMYSPPKIDPKGKPTFDTRSGAPPAAKKVRVERERPPPRPERGNMGRGGDMRGPNSNSRRPYGRGEPLQQQQQQQEPANVVDDATHKLMVEEFLQNTRGRSRSPGGRRRRHRSRSRSPHRSHRRESRRSPSPLREGDIWQAYRHLVDRSKAELDQMYREYRSDPEKHPVYDEEWRKFWKHRKDQLAREGLDHRNYDFQPEWVRYFAVRIEELYDEAVEDIKISARRRLILPMTNDELVDKKYHIKNAVKSNNSDQQQNKPGRVTFADNTQNTTVVGVLRLLTALEDYLGSLGPKVVDLLSKALLVEKTNPREINDIILNLENCTILETAMEKLKGVLIAGLLEGPKVRAFNNVITETDKILRMAYKIRQENPQPQPVMRTHPLPVPAPKNQQQDFNRKSFSPTPMARNSSSGGGGVSAGGGGGGGGGGGSGGGNVGSSGAAASLLSQIDKKELATKLAAALTAQGKTDFNPEQLQQLIAVYSLIDKKKRDSAAASDKQKMTLSDTLTALLNPSSHKGEDPDGNSPQPLLSNRSAGGGGGSGGNYSNNNDKFGSINNSSISNFVSMLNRDNNVSSGGSGNGGDSEMWHNLQNIQSSLRSQNKSSSNADTGFGNNSANGGRGGFGNNQMGGGGGQGGQGQGAGGGGNFNSDRILNRGENHGGDVTESGFRSGYQGMNNSNPSRMGGNDDNIIAGGRGINDALGIGGRVGSDMISRGRVGNNSMMGGGNDMMSGGRPGGNNFSGGNSIGFGSSNYSRSGMGGANNTLGFSRSSFLGSGPGGSGSYSNFSGLSNFSTSISLDSVNPSFSRSSLGNIGGGAGGGGSSFNRGGFGMNTSGIGGNFNNPSNQNNSGGGPSFGSAPNQRNNNTQVARGSGGSTWRNQ